MLAKTIKGYGMGEAGEAQNIAHQAKKMEVEAIRIFRDRFSIPITDEKIGDKMPFLKPPEDSDDMKYLRERMAELGIVPQRRRKSASLAVPELSAFDAQLQGTGDRHISTTMAFVRILNTIARDREIGPRVVPIVADESRTFGMEGMFRQLGIYSSIGQLYHPQDAEQLMWYREDKLGQILQEGINEAGALSSWIAAGTSYTNHDLPMIPFYIFYSMFGFQRVGDLTWAAGDSRTRGFLLGGTSGRTTLNGEGLQHEDGSSQVAASFVPNCVSYDPTFAYELAVIMQDGLRRMLTDQEDVYYYITLMNENYQHPAMPPDVGDGILRGMYLLRDGGAAKGKTPRVQLFGSGAILREVIAAADLLADEWNVISDVWSVTSFNELQRDGVAARRVESAASAGEAASLVRRAVPGGPRRPRHRRHRLHPRVRRTDPSVRGAPLRCARHRRLRPQRFPAQAARVLRGGPAFRDGRRAPRAGRRGHGSPGDRRQGAGEVPHRPQQTQSNHRVRT